MRRATRAVLLALAATLAAPTLAHAEFFFSRTGAERVTRDSASKRYSEFGVTFESARASCRPQGEPFNPRFKYHRWVCGWADADNDGNLCSGVLLIIGRSSAGAYTSQVLRGMRCR